MHWLLMALLGLGSVPTPRFADKVPAEGRWFAADSGAWTPTHFTILHLTPSGLATVFSSTTPPYTFAWADADTLVTLETYAPPFRMRWYDAGVFGAEVDLPPTVTFDAWRPRFGVAPDGSAWLIDCDFEPCKGAMVVRVTRDGHVDFQDQAPLDLRRPTTTGIKPKPVAPPTGYSAALTKVELDGVSHKGATCTSPTGTTTWPDPTTDLEDAVRPWKVTWVDADPPILALRGNPRNVLGDDEATTSYFEGCTMDPIRDYRVLGDGLWLRRDALLPTANAWERTDTWSLWWNDIKIDQVAGDASGVQMAPY